MYSQFHEVQVEKVIRLKIEAFQVALGNESNAFIVYVAGIITDLKSLAVFKWIAAQRPTESAVSGVSITTFLPNVFACHDCVR